MDKLAVIQSDQTIDELKKIEVSTRALVDVFNELKTTTDSVNKGLLSGLPKDMALSLKEISKAYNIVNNSMQQVTATSLKLKTAMDRAHSSQKQLNNSAGTGNANPIKVSAEEAANALNEFTSSYDQLNRAYIKARNNAREMAVQHGIMSKEFVTATAQAEKYKTQLNQVDTAMLQYGRNTGDYSSHILGLNMQMQQVMREVPNFAMDARIGIAALSNNLPYLADAISEVSRQSKILKAEFKLSAAAAKEKAIAEALAAGASEKHAMALGKQAEAQIMANYQAQKAPPLWKQVATSILNWQTLLVLGISLMVAYSKEIGDWAESLLEGNSALAKLKKTQREYNDAVKEGMSSASEEVSRLRTLYAIATDVSVAIEKRKEASSALIKLYPDIFGKMSRENIMVGKAINLYKTLEKQIIATAKARAIENQLTKVEEERLVSLEENRNKLVKAYESKMKFDSGDYFLPFGGEETYEKAVNQNIKNILNDRLKINKDYFRERDYYTKQLLKTDVPLYEDDLDAVKVPKEKKPKKPKDTTNEEYRLAREHIEKMYKIRRDAINDNIELTKQDPFLSEMGKIEVQAKYYDDLEKLNNDFYNDLIDNARKYKKESEAVDFETQKGSAEQDINKQRLALANQISEAFKTDTEYMNQMENSFESLAYEEKKKKIMNDIFISQSEREFQLSLLELRNNRDNLLIENQRMDTRKKRLEAKGRLTRDEAQELAAINAALEKNTNLLKENEQAEENTRNNRLKDKLAPAFSLVTGGLEALGFGSVVDEMNGLWDSLWDSQATWQEKAQKGFEMVSAFASEYINRAADAKIEALDRELRASEEATEMEMDFLEKRLGMLNALDNASKEQLEERNAIEDEMRVLREQQMAREKSIEAQKAKAQQKANAAQAIINGLLAATQTLANMGVPAGIPFAATAAGLGVLNAALIMAQDPVPKYFKGRDGGDAEWAFTQERGREIITDKSGNIKSLGESGGAKLTWLEKGDKVLTATQTQRALKEVGKVGIGDNLFHSAARRNVAPVIVSTPGIDYDKLASRVGDKFENALNKYDKVSTFENERGEVFLQKGGRIPQYIGRRKQPRLQVKINDNARN